MIKGMTGFGTAVISYGGIRGAVEVKSLNHRYLDIAYYLPPGFSSVENKIRELLQKSMERGRITVAIRITTRPSPTVYLNKSAVRDYLRYAREIKKDFHINGNLSVCELLRFPGVVDTRETGLDAEMLWPAIEKSFQKAIYSLVDMRKREGKSLVADIKKQLTRMLLQIKMIKARAKAVLKEKKAKVSAEEFSSFQKGADVNEELSRLAHHIDEFSALLTADSAMGKKLDFIAQEMQRETNTIGSKLQDKIVSNAVIALKSKIEKIREQSQNIE